MKITLTLASFAAVVSISYGRLHAPDHDEPEPITPADQGDSDFRSQLSPAKTVHTSDGHIRDLRKRPCGNGRVGNAICEDTKLCCSEWGWCGESHAHCRKSIFQPPNNGGEGEAAYITYHYYFPGQSLTQVSCSDGANGLITRWGYKTVDPMFPYVAATSNLSWNSPVCGTCYAVTSDATGKTVYVTTIDKVANPGPGGELHFDMAYDAFYELLGNVGYLAGSGYATYKAVDSSYCKTPNN